MDPSDDDFLTARWTGRHSGRRRPLASWRARLGAGVLGFVVLAPVSLALRDDTEMPAPPALSGSATVTVRPLVTTTTTTTPVAPTTTTITTITTITTTTTTTTTLPPCGQRFEVRRGDSWYGLAEAAGVAVRDLLAVNGARPTSVLLPGDSICLPRGARRPPPPTTTTTTTTKAPVPRSTTTTTTTTMVVPTRASTDEVLRLIREVWPPERHDEAILIAQRESRLRSDVRNACCWGLFQINFQAHRTWLASVGVSEPVQLLDAATNVRVARALFLRSNGWGPWGW
jgi:LysM repeat protein